MGGDSYLDVDGISNKVSSSASKLHRESPGKKVHDGWPRMKKQKVDDCWLGVDDKVWDLSNLISSSSSKSHRKSQGEKSIENPTMKVHCRKKSEMIHMWHHAYDACTKYANSRALHASCPLTCTSWQLHSNFKTTFICTVHPSCFSTSANPFDGMPPPYNHVFKACRWNSGKNGTCYWPFPVKLEISGGGFNYSNSSHWSKSDFPGVFHWKCESRCPYMHLFPAHISPGFS
jgi:hypothetical protein